ncbi:MAG: pentapeptide repeat-containing protein [Bacteroidia bacterium]|nr:pentapeptide repeat-containing protein [Bacteroidia bacterium]
MRTNRYTGDITYRDFRSKDLSECVFEGANLSGSSFTHAKLKHTRFKNCYCSEDAPVDFEWVDFSESTIEECRFPRSIFRNAQIISCKITYLELTEGNLIGCRFDNSLIEGLNISCAQLHLSSFVDSRIVSIEYKPTIQFPELRGLSFIEQRTPMQRTIFINHNSHLGFTEFCHKEARKDRLYSNFSNRYQLVNAVLLFFLLAYGLLTDYGTSVGRWFLCSLAIQVVFAFVLLFYNPILNIATSLWYSVKCFFNVGIVPNEIREFLAVESIIGYFMLGILISLLTSKLTTR